MAKGPFKEGDLLNTAVALFTGSGQNITCAKIMLSDSSFHSWYHFDKVGLFYFGMRFQIRINMRNMLIIFVCTLLILGYK